MIVIVGGLTASGVLLAVAALVAVLLNRGSLGVALFIASSVVLAVLTFGWAVAMTVLRLSGRSRWAAPSRDQPPDSTRPQ
jgi:hypothetical protein